MRRLRVPLKGAGRSYPIHLGKGALEQTALSLKALPLGERYAVITDRNVKRLYADRLMSELDWAGLPAQLFAFPGSERSKTLETVERLTRRLARAGFARGDAVIALGGGVVGDVAGFVAATYMRGLPYVQVPTTLLAMVDSSIGGKVGVDLPEGKNLVGHFWHPARVFVDPTCLETLPERQRRCGWAEVAKHAVIADREHFVWLEKNVRRLLGLKPKAMIDVLATSLQIKSRVVRKDERESDWRKVLNYGHTIGHALESLTDYRLYTHGEAVAIGMAVEGRVAVALGFWPGSALARQNRLLEALGFDLSVPSIPPRDLLRALRRDKKVAHGEVTFALPRRIGAMKTVEGKVGVRVERRVILHALRESS